MSEDAAVRAALDVLTRAALGKKAAPPASPKIAALWLRYWREFARHQKSARDKKRIGELLLCRFGDREALTLTTADCEDYRDWRREQPTRLGGKAMPATLNRELAQLRHLLNWAVRLGLLKYNPIAFVKMEREHNVRRSQLRSEEDFQAMLVHLNTTIRALAILFVDSGPRRMEAVNLRWDEFDHKTGVMDLFDTKGDEPRRPRMSKRALEAVLALPRISQHVFANWRPGPWYGNRIDPGTALKHVQKAFKAAGVPPARGEAWGLHLLRHAYVRRSRVRDRLPERMVMKQTGHKTRVAFDRYGIGDDSELEEAFKIADANIGAAVLNLRKPPHRGPEKVAEGGSRSAKLQSG
jgi:integrase